MKRTTKLFSFIFAFILLFTGQSFVKATDQYSGNLIPAMTSNTSPSGIASASAEYVDSFGNCLAYEGFDHINLGHYKGEWLIVGSAGWLAYEFPAETLVNKYTITSANYNDAPYASPNRSPKEWKFEGSNDGINWDALDIQQNQINWSSNEKREFVINNSIPYKKFRINITSNNGGSSLAIGELEMMQKISTPPTTPLNLYGTTGNTVDHLTWDAVTGATAYNIKRSTTPGGPYETIASNVTGTTYDDTSVTNGTTYYYVVTAVNSDGESPNSNEVALTPQGQVTPPPPASGDKALLRITMTTGEEKEYDLSSSEVGDFVNWYQNHSTSDKPAYVFNKTFNVGPFTSRKEYIAFERIQSFEVMEYNQ